MSLQALMAADAAAIAAMDGVAITYVQDGASSTIKCIVNAGPVEPASTVGGKTVSQDVTIAVSKTDLPTVKPQLDQVVVPGAWFRDWENETVRARVAAVTGDASNPGFWLLKLRKGV